jgi:hypothetical protein
MVTRNGVLIASCAQKVIGVIVPPSDGTVSDSNGWTDCAADEAADIRASPPGLSD